ncbi:hypothetical protein GCM10011391_10080 [Pullulanibacillus camelliae]|uniref:Uncharacterized protein n=1 Tax=Pullulanibacillus camelliae TaxID=1707096 RepID=A0A8J2VJV0_9BACL|nr:hypothetical protein GCM10011391_10080 [Pullulanibacillus camelliae]
MGDFYFDKKDSRALALLDYNSTRQVLTANKHCDDTQVIKGYKDMPPETSIRWAFTQ